MRKVISSPTALLPLWRDWSDKNKIWFCPRFESFQVPQVIPQTLIEFVLVLDRREWKGPSQIVHKTVCSINQITLFLHHFLIVWVSNGFEGFEIMVIIKVVLFPDLRNYKSDSLTGSHTPFQFCFFLFFALLCLFLSSPEEMLLDCRERARVGERERNIDVTEKHRWVAPPLGPNQGPISQPWCAPWPGTDCEIFLVYGMMLQPTEPHQPGLFALFLHFLFFYCTCLWIQMVVISGLAEGVNDPQEWCPRPHFFQICLL